MRIYGNLGTLYSQCGGVFGVAAFVDRCMDKWMSDPRCLMFATAQADSIKFNRPDDDDPDCLVSCSVVM